VACPVVFYKEQAMSLLMRIYLGTPLSPTPGSCARHNGHENRLGPVFGHIHFFHYSDGRFYLRFYQKERQDQASQLTGWQPVDIAPINGTITQELCLPFTHDQKFLTCFDVGTGAVTGYSAFDLESRNYEETMRLCMMIRESYGASQLVLNRIIRLTFSQCEFSVWLEDENAFHRAQKETGWKTGDDAFSLVLPLDMIHSAILLAE